MRFFGALVLVVALALLGFSLYAAATTSRMGAGLAVVSEAFEQPLDRSDWQRHWLAISLGNAILGAAFLVAGLGLVGRRSWATLAWASAVTLALVAAAVPMTLGPKYQFEVTEPLGLLVLALGAAVSWVFHLRRVRQVSSHHG
jgi:hypothetical protein